MSSTDRLLTVLTLLRTPAGQTLRTLAQRFGVSKGAIQRDIDHLSRQGVGVREEQVGQTLRYFVDDSTWPPAVTAPTQLPFAALAALFPWRRAAWCKSMSVTTALPGRLDAAGPEPRSCGGLRVSEAVSEAMRSGRLLRLTYRARRMERRRRVTLEPVRLRAAGGLQYLDAYRHEDGAFRTYALHRCVEARTLERGFVPRPAPPRTAFGAVEGAARPVRVRFAPEVADFIAERVWHPSERLVRRADGSAEWTATVSGTEEFLGWVMSWSPWAELESPRAWRDLIVDRANAMLASHGRARPR